MTDFSRARRLRTRSPTIRLDPLPPGHYRFELIVTDTAGNDSAPAQVEVIVEPAQTHPGPAPADPPRSGGGGP